MLICSLTKKLKEVSALLTLKKNIEKTRFRPLSQAGINMVDLMMWLVIAALLLAAAIQGIGYYQKAAYLNTMKSDAVGVGDKSLAVAANTTGIIDKAAVDQGALDTNWSADVTYSVETPSQSGLKPYVRISHPSVTDTDVVYLFDSCGDDYSVGVNTIPKGGSPVLTACGITPTSPGGGGTEGGGSTGVTFAPLTATNPENTAATSDMIYYMNKHLEAIASPDFLALVKTSYGTDEYTAASDAYYSGDYYLNMYKVNAEIIKRDIWDMEDTEQNVWTSSEYAALKTAYNNKSNSFENLWPNTGTQTQADQQGQVDAQRALYAHLLNSPHKAKSLVAYAGNPSGFITEITVAAGNTPITAIAALPADAPSSITDAKYYIANDSGGYGSGSHWTLPAMQTDANGVRYWEYTITPGMDQWTTGGAWESGKTYYVGLTTGSWGAYYQSTIKVTVQ